MEINLGAYAVDIAYRSITVTGGVVSSRPYTLERELQPPCKAAGIFSDRGPDRVPFAGQRLPR